MTAKYPLSGKHRGRVPFDTLGKQDDARRRPYVLAGAQEGRPMVAILVMVSSSQRTLWTTDFFHLTWISKISNIPVVADHYEV
jgi:hypothetical protein